jgi:hypothetical protein
MVMSWDQNAGQNRYIQVGNKLFETVEQFKYKVVQIWPGLFVCKQVTVCPGHIWTILYLGTTLTNQNSIHAEIKSSLKSGNACYHSVHSLLSSGLLSTNVKIKIHRTVFLPVVLYGCKLGCSHWGRNVGWEFSRMGCWGGCLDLGGMR